MLRKQRVEIYPLRNITPVPLPSRDEVLERLRDHPEMQMIRRGGRELGRWWMVPLGGDAWVQWGLRAKPDKLGMSYSTINKITAYPEPPEVGPVRASSYSRWVSLDPLVTPENQPKISKYGASRELDRKDLVWIDGAAELAEEALDRQWRPTRTLRWEQMQPLPEDLERAFDQFDTYLIQANTLCSDILGPWIRLVHFSFLEIKSYLAYELFDYNLATGNLRKRLLANGGGFGIQVDGFEAGILDICNEVSHAFAGEVERDFNAMVFALDVTFNGFLVDILRLAAAGAVTPFDRGLYTQMLQDAARHVAWGSKRIRYYLDHATKREEAALRLHAIADRLEPAQVEGHLLNPKVFEPLAVILGGGVDCFDQGLTILRAYWPQFGGNYLARLDAIGLPRHGRTLLPIQAPF